MNCSCQRSIGPVTGSPRAGMVKSRLRTSDAQRLRESVVMLVVLSVCCADASVRLGQHAEGVAAARLRRTDPPVQVWPRHVHATDLLEEPGGTGLLQSRLSIDVCLRAALKPDDRFARRRSAIQTVRSVTGAKRGCGDRMSAKGARPEHETRAYAAIQKARRSRTRTPTRKRGRSSRP